MHRHALGLTAACLALAPGAVAADSPSILFPMKTFTDTGHMVHVAVTLTLSAEGVNHPTNTSAVTSYQERHQCELVVVSTAALQIFSLGIPHTFIARDWEPDRIVADFATPCGNPPNAVFAKEWQVSTSETLIIDRNRQTLS
jgi:hypothetical protein